MTNGKPKKPPRNAEPVDSLGETWWLSELTPALMKAYAAPIRARARQSLIEDRSVLSEEQYEEEKKFLQARIDAGAYEWGPPVELGGTGPGESVKVVLDTPEGMVRLIQLLLLESHGEIPTDRAGEIMAGNPEGITAALRAAMGLPPLPPAKEKQTSGETEKTMPEPMTPAAP